MQINVALACDENINTSGTLYIPQSLCLFDEHKQLISSLWTPFIQSWGFSAQTRRLTLIRQVSSKVIFGCHWASFISCEETSCSPVFLVFHSSWPLANHLTGLHQAPLPSCFHLNMPPWNSEWQLTFDFSLLKLGMFKQLSSLFQFIPSQDHNSWLNWLQNVPEPCNAWHSHMVCQFTSSRAVS